MTKPADRNQQDPQNMGGPSFHPDISQDKAKDNGGKIETPDTAILKEDQVPPL